MADGRRSTGFIFTSLIIIVALLICLSTCNESKKSAKKKDEKLDKKIGKSVLDYSEGDMQKLLDQWEDNDEDEEDKYDDDDPRKPKPPAPAFDPSKIKDDPMSFVKLAKKGKVIMMFAAMAGNPTRRKTEEVTSRWQMSLHNAHLQVERYIVADDRALFLLKDGSIAWEVKDFLITQLECKMVEFDNQKFPGAGDKTKETEQQKSEL